MKKLPPGHPRRPRPPNKKRKRKRPNPGPRPSMPWDTPPDPVTKAADFAAMVATRLALNLADYLLDRLGIPRPAPPGPPPADVARQIEKDNPIELKKGRDFEILE